MAVDRADHALIWIHDEVLRGGFTQIPNLVLAATAISAGAKLTYIGLLSFAWQKGSCYPGQDTLAERIGAGRRSVVRYLQELESVGLLVVTRRGQGLTNLYELPRIDGELAKRMMCQVGATRGATAEKCQVGTSSNAPAARPAVPAWPHEEDPDEADEGEADIGGLPPPPQLWQAVLAELRGVVPPTTHASWLKTARAVRASRRKLTIAAPNTFAADWLKTRLRGQIEKAAHRVSGLPLELEVVVDSG